MVGAFNSNHITDDCFEELARILKPGKNVFFKWFTFSKCSHYLRLIFHIYVLALLTGELKGRPTSFIPTYLLSMTACLLGIMMFAICTTASLSCSGNITHYNLSILLWHFAPKPLYLVVALCTTSSTVLRRDHALLRQEHYPLCFVLGMAHSGGKVIPTCMTWLFLCHRFLVALHTTTSASCGRTTH